jgi:hypothetical protein
MKKNFRRLEYLDKQVPSVSKTGKLKNFRQKTKIRTPTRNLQTILSSFFYLFVCFPISIFKGRVHLNTGWANNGTFGVSQGFGIHTVWAAGKDDSRADASGSLSVADVEDLFDSKLGDFST